MTAPIQTDFPDWGRYSARAAKTYFNDTAGASAVQVTEGPFFVGDVEHLYLFFLAVTGNTRVGFSFYDAEIPSVLVASHMIELNANDFWSQTIPVLGPWVTVTLYPDAGPITYWMTLSQAAGSFISSEGDAKANVLFSTDSVAHPVGVTTYDMTRIMATPAVLFVQLPAVISSVSLYSVDTLGVQTLLSRVIGNGLTVSALVNLPNTHLRIGVVNAGGAPANFSVSLMANQNGI